MDGASIGTECCQAVDVTCSVGPGSDECVVHGVEKLKGTVFLFSRRDEGREAQVIHQIQYHPPSATPNRLPCNEAVPFRQNPSQVGFNHERLMDVANPSLAGDAPPTDSKRPGLVCKTPCRSLPQPVLFLLPGDYIKAGPPTVCQLLVFSGGLKYLSFAEEKKRKKKKLGCRRDPKQRSTLVGSKGTSTSSPDVAQPGPCVKARVRQRLYILQYVTAELPSRSPRLRPAVCPVWLNQIKSTQLPPTTFMV
ncbi:hypothetical protein BO78DRAFT_40287 [Aspergillus sclerotiicarbonarius CBS 121057]|uniref:Uncharacterized protein n=1 Tax=Aspergillus sclerotiicarbonarius (strain CBS 121057 / IBT 28362) TaxID=1448318 RepID=A0A319EIE1_ASPSB|nr:hypothetical protein BO78DRAFT_40287 [Aspergillus sclerotiicarbonarius CBS 121057]